MLSFLTCKWSLCGCSLAPNGHYSIRHTPHCSSHYRLLIVIFLTLGCLAWLSTCQPHLHGAFVSTRLFFHRAIKLKVSITCPVVFVCPGLGSFWPNHWVLHFTAYTAFNLSLFLPLSLSFASYCHRSVGCRPLVESSAVLHLSVWLPKHY